MPRMITKKEYRKRRIRFQIAAGLSDFIITVVCVAAAGICAVLLKELWQWLKGDVPESFGVFFTIIKRALHMNW